MTFIIKRYTAQVQGHQDVEVFGSTPGKARARAYRSYSSAYDACSFKRFLQISRLIRARTKDPEHFGAPIIVSNKPAYYVEHRGRDICFVFPESDCVMRSHYMNVILPWEL